LQSLEEYLNSLELLTGNKREVTLRALGLDDNSLRMARA